ncbi:uncharacterized protein SPPG_07558 [Spizellomyces punctatus DAOM BR117]|uniref:ATP synthase subunit d, mitochondrial n=1 Tax=Spizellomyces punctatus (strain DAOM BR117) TaxID=645134 RepID=A0A0L0H895_SPIPD|nr:uncharacterized protein SPPG_07558 [Spizellomyces punctatus DAOM BR117]KNC97171.1 hypothetical protein SPPG_07558 [Spizellomyces punctatus DAOM BR117]|eukprot:XP_016605211.1 hypothetical protein SPPG_07558 [Spizellomyces punctatus DAOM BR117]
MSAKPSTAASKINWASVTQKLRPETAQKLNAFRRQHTELVKEVMTLQEQLQRYSIDFDYYSRVLKNKKVVLEAKRAIENMKPLPAFDVESLLKMIDDEKKKALESAKKTEEKVGNEVSELRKMMDDIEHMRAPEQLIVDDVFAAYPQDLDAVVAKMAKRGQWRMPGYYERFGEFTIGF